jgi:hypothetical protein
MSAHAMNYEQTAEEIALAIWETSTANGHKMDKDLWDSHMQNCHAATANSYREDISEADWHKAALAKITGAA